ncbi:MAG: AAA family ATPase, partial [Gammaproteobacteria bacterium]|nr:AAA family ATPase [Gammaproteobacteria bacterium]
MVDTLMGVSDEGFYYIWPQLEQRINLLYHLVRYSKLTLLLTGREGAGKTTLINRLTEDPREPWHVCGIEASILMDPVQLMERITSGFDLPIDNSSIFTQEKNLRLHLESLRNGARTALLVIENAHLLSAETRAYVSQMSADKSCDGLRLLLTGEAHLAEATHAVSAGGKVFSHIIDIPPLNPDQTKEYIRLCLKDAVPEHSEPFSEQEMEWIYKESAGFPGLIKLAASKILTGQSQDEPQCAPITDQVLRRNYITAHLPRLKKPGMAAVTGAVVLAVAMLWLFFSQETPQPSRPDVLELSLPEPPMVTASHSKGSSYEPTGITAQPSTVNTVPLDGQPQSVSLLRMPAGLGNSEPSTMISDKSTLPAKKPISSDTTPKTEPLHVTRKKPGQETPSTATPTTIPPPTSIRRDAVKVVKPSKVTKKKPTLPAKQSGKLKSDGWLLRQKPGYYTIQLIGTHDRSAAMEFIRTHRLQRKASWFHTIHADKDWYVVVLGVYKSRKSALKAIRSLPTPLRRHGPWARTIKSVHEG